MSQIDFVSAGTDIFPLEIRPGLSPTEREGWKESVVLLERSCDPVEHLINILCRPTEFLLHLRYRLLYFVICPLSPIFPPLSFPRQTSSQESHSGTFSSTVFTFHSNNNFICNSSNWSLAACSPIGKLWLISWCSDICPVFSSRRTCCDVNLLIFINNMMNWRVSAGLSGAWWSLAVSLWTPH